MGLNACFVPLRLVLSMLCYTEEGTKCMLCYTDGARIYSIQCYPEDSTKCMLCSTENGNKCLLFFTEDGTKCMFCYTEDSARYIWPFCSPSLYELQKNKTCYPIKSIQKVLFIVYNVVEDVKGDDSKAMGGCHGQCVTVCCSWYQTIKTSYEDAHPNLLITVVWVVHYVT